jgi:anti-anti-sigma regulatory factor
MLVPTFTAHADLRRHHVVVGVHGPLATVAHGDALLDSCLPLPSTYGLIVNLSGITFVTDTGVQALRRLAEAVTSAGHRVAVVCAELLLRADLLLADLDHSAPVLDAEEHAWGLVGFAA